MQGKSRFGIGAIIGGMIAVLGSALVIFSALQMRDRYAVWQSAQKIAEFATLDKQLFAALQAFRFERGDSNAALGLPPERVADATRTVKANREIVDRALAPVFARTSLDVAGWDKARRDLAAGHEQMKTLRAAVDRAFGEPLAGRDQALSKSYGSRTLDFVATIDRAVDVLDREIQRIDPIAGKLIFAKRLAWNVRATAGNLALAVMTPLAGERGFTADERRTIANLSASTEIYWALLRDTVTGTADADRLGKAITEKGAAYFSGSYADRLKRTIEQLATGRQSIFALAEFQSATSDAMRAVGEASDILMDAAIDTAEEAEGSARTAAIVNAGAIVLALSLAIGGFLFVGSRVVRPIRAMTGCMARLAGNDADVVVPCTGRRDEIGDMAAAVEIFKTGMIRNRALEQEAVALRERGEADRKRALQELATTFEQSVGGIVDRVAVTARSLEDAARVLSASADKSATQSGAVAAAAEEAGSNVANVASAAEEMGASISEIVRRVEQAAKMSQGVVTQSSETSCLVQDLSVATGRIGDILNMISTIAGQTNLLALNATIEAARAGEAGKGFAVVAAEVKNLADLTAKATADIGRQIGAIQESTQKASAAMSTISGAIDGVNQMTAAISTAAEQQGAATQQIVGNIHEASMGTREVTSNISGVAAAIGETGEAAGQVLSSSTDLARMASRLKQEVDGFLQGIRAA
jgi:methyl-accepting chemotaxis protein